MIIVSVPTDKLVNEDGQPTPSWGNYFDQNTQQMQQSLSQEGFWIPDVSSDPNSVTPMASGGQLAQVAASFGTQGGINAGTVVFDSYEVNGATPPARNGQLKVMLNDGNFHAITNT